MYRGYMPLTGPWSECRILKGDNLLLKSWGKVKPSDVQLVHRYKLSKKEIRADVLQILKSKHLIMINIYLIFTIT